MSFIGKQLHPNDSLQLQQYTVLKGGLCREFDASPVIVIGVTKVFLSLCRLERGVEWRGLLRLRIPIVSLKRAKR